MIKWIQDKYQAWSQTNKYYAISVKNVIDANQNSEKIERKIHDTYYSYLLFDYILNVRKTLKQKRALKAMFFCIIMTIFLLTFGCFLYSIKNVTDIIEVIEKGENLDNKKIIIEMITVIIPPLFSLIVAFIKIPEIIAKYLFNIKEEEYMTSIIKDLQDYDKAIYSIEKKIEVDLDNTNIYNDIEMYNFPEEDAE